MDSKMASVNRIDDSSNIEDLIHVVRGVQIMLDSDIAFLYGVETKRLNENVKRNLERFPENFRFQLTDEEYKNLRSQNSTSSDKEKYGGRRYLPYAFTEQGVAMLSAVLKSSEAVKVSVGIMDAFVKMRKYIADNNVMLDRIHDLEMRQLSLQAYSEENFNKIFSYISVHEEPKQKIFFDGQIYDAYSFLISIIAKANKNIILIDGYVDNYTLDMFSKKKMNVAIKIYTNKKTPITEQDVKKFNSQYGGLEIYYTARFHDRFMLLDDNTAYHIGASIKDAGKKCFAVNLIEDAEIINLIKQKLHN